MKFQPLADQIEQPIVQDNLLSPLGEDAASPEIRLAPDDALSFFAAKTDPLAATADDQFSIKSVNDISGQTPGRDPLIGGGTNSNIQAAPLGDNDLLLTAGKWTASLNKSTDWIIVMDARSSELPAQAAERAARAVGGQVGFVFNSAIRGFVVKGVTEARIQQLLVSNPGFLFAERDREVSLPTPFSQGPQQNQQDISASSTEVIPWGINRIGGSGNGIGKTAWVLDSGIDLDHPDLNVDAARGFSAFTSRREASPDDGNGHGTHVAGTIGAIDNEIGVVGVAAGATVVPVKVLNRAGSGALSGVIAGIDYVAANANAGDVANLSLGGGVSTTIDQAVINLSRSGVKVVIAAGNSADNVENYSPGRVDGPDLYTISAMDINDTFANFSNYGVGIDFAAPGVGIQSTWKNGGYRTISGTSMAAPHVAGILLLGDINSDGVVIGDPDGMPDPIAHR